MATIKNIVFDLGGVIMDIDRASAVKRFQEIGVADIEQYLGLYAQKGIFMEVEEGRIDDVTFCRKLSELVGKQISYQDILSGWLAFITDVPTYKLNYIVELRKQYNVYLLSNTNPFIQQWARSEAFSAQKLPIGAYFDKMYASYEIGFTKPGHEIYDYMIADSGIVATQTLFIDDGLHNVEMGQKLGFYTYQPIDNEDWRSAVTEILA